jgi:hypothetical protein
MGSIVSHIEDILEEYGTWENYLEKSGTYDANIRKIMQTILQMKKDFEAMTFREFMTKYDVDILMPNTRNQHRDFIMGQIKGVDYFTKKKF